MNTKQFIKVLTADGWYEVRQRGSHKQYKHETKIGTVTIPYHGDKKEVPKGLANAILKQAGLK